LHPIFSIPSALTSVAGSPGEDVERSALIDERAEFLPRLVPVDEKDESRAEKLEKAPELLAVAGTVHTDGEREPSALELPRRMLL
jgi:hypothetical protein